MRSLFELRPAAQQQVDLLVDTAGLLSTAHHSAFLKQVLRTLSAPLAARMLAETVLRLPLKQRLLMLSRLVSVLAPADRLAVIAIVTSADMSPAPPTPGHTASFIEDALEAVRASPASGGGGGDDDGGASSGGDGDDDDDDDGGGGGGGGGGGVR